MDSRFGKPDSIFHGAANTSNSTNLFKPGRCTILQLSDIEQHEQQVIVGALAAARQQSPNDDATRGEETPKERGDFVRLSGVHTY